MKTFSSLALQRDVAITKYTVDEIIHSRLFKLAAVASLAAELSRSPYFFLQEIADIWESCHR